MDFHGHINLQDNEMQKMVLQTETGFPEAPIVGRICFTEKRVYICVEIAAGTPVWIPLTNEINLYVHTQDTSSVTWTITHNLNTTTPLVQIYDLNYKMIIPDEIAITDANTVTVTLGTAAIGKAVVMYGDITGGDKRDIQYSYTHYQTNTSDTWVISHGLGYEPIVRVFIVNEEVQPASIIHDSVFQTTITFSSTQVGIARLI